MQMETTFIDGLQELNTSVQPVLFPLSMDFFPPEE